MTVMQPGTQVWYEGNGTAATAEIIANDERQIVIKLAGGTRIRIEARK